MKSLSCNLICLFIIISVSCRQDEIEEKKLLNNTRANTSFVMIKNEDKLFTKSFVDPQSTHVIIAGNYKKKDCSDEPFSLSYYDLGSKKEPNECFWWSRRDKDKIHYNSVTNMECRQDNEGNFILCLSQFESKDCKGLKLDNRQIFQNKCTKFSTDEKVFYTKIIKMENSETSCKKLEETFRCSFKNSKAQGLN